MRIGFIGGSGHHYLRGCLKTAGIEAAWASDGLATSAAESAARSSGVTRFDDDARKMFDTFKPDVVSIGAVFSLNGDWAIECATRSIPVVSDKPVATTWEQLQQLREASRGRIILTEFPFRTEAPFRAARQAIQQGSIGKPVLTSVQKSYRLGTRPPWYGQRETFGGLVLWVASHAIDLIPFVTGDHYARVTGRGANLSHPEYPQMEDHVALMMEMDSGASAVIHADYLRPAAASTHGDDRLRVIGSAGLIEVRDDKCTLTTSASGQTDITDSAGALPMHEALLAAINGDASLYSTEQTLSMAETLLRMREAVDRQQWLATSEGELL